MCVLKEVPWAGIEAVWLGYPLGWRVVIRMGGGMRFSEPPIHLLCRRMGYAFRAYKEVVSPGDAFLAIVSRILRGSWKG